MQMREGNERWGPFLVRALRVIAMHYRNLAQHWHGLGRHPCQSFYGIRRLQRRARIGRAKMEH